MKDVRVTQLENGNLDVLLTDGKSTYAEAAEQVAQHGVMRLKRFKGESVTDNPNDDGTDYYGIIFKANKTRAEKEFELKRVILGTPGVRKIISFEWEQDGHNVLISSTIETEFGETSFSTGVSPL